MSTAGRHSGEAGADGGRGGGGERGALGRLRWGRMRRGCGMGMAVLGKVSACITDGAEDSAELLVVRHGRSGLQVSVGRWRRGGAGRDGDPAGGGGDGTDRSLDGAVARVAGGRSAARGAGVLWAEPLRRGPFAVAAPAGGLDVPGDDGAVRRGGGRVYADGADRVGGPGAGAVGGGLGAVGVGAGGERVRAAGAGLLPRHAGRTDAGRLGAADTRRGERGV
jgi:hypothetical protein